MNLIGSKSVDDLEAGDLYLWGEVGQSCRTVREVLGVDARGPFGVLLEVRKDDGNVVRSALSGFVDMVRP